jgi:hypothetical protein
MVLITTCVFLLAVLVDAQKSPNSDQFGMRLVAEGGTTRVVALDPKQPHGSHAPVAATA